MKGVAQERKRKENPYNKHHFELGNYESIPFKFWDKIWIFCINTLIQ